MRLRTLQLVPLAGVVCGFLSVYPSKLRFVPTMLLWGGVGIAIGLTVARRSSLRGGVVYGLALLIGFFVASLFVNGEALENPVFDVFVVAVTPIAAVAAVEVGSRIGRRRSG